MAVIYMPQDPRMALLSQAFMQAGQNVGDYYENKQLSAAAQQAVKTGDTSGLVKLGPKGVEYAKLLTEMAASQAKTKEATANTEKAGAETAGIKLKNEAYPQEEAFKFAKEQSEIVKNAAQAKHDAAQTLLVQAQTENEPIKRQQMLAQANKDTVEAENMLKAQELITAILHPDNKLKASDGTTPAIPTIGEVLGPNATPGDRTAVALAGASGKPGEMANTIVSIERKNTPLALPGDAAKIAGNAGATANNLGQVLDGIEGGQIKGGPIDSMLSYAQDKGWVRPGTERGAAMEAIHQLTFNRATAGGGFGGQWKINISKDTLPNFRKGPAQNIVSVAVIAQDQLAELMAEKKRFAGTKTQTAALDEAIAQTQKIIDRANTLKVDKAGNVYLGKSILQGKNGYSPPDMLPSGQTLSIGNKTFTAEQLNGAAIQAGVNVTDIIATLRQKASAQ